jgi:DNA-binding ferritin-like protein
MAAKKKSGSRKSAAKKKAAKRKAPKSRKPRAAKKKVAEKKVVKAQVSPAVADIDNRIAILRNNLRDLTEQATAYSGASTEELMSDRISEHEARLATLLKQRDKLARG